MKLGVISDTHDYLDPRVAGLFAGVEHILHAGDIGERSIIAELELIAPVTAVLGNNDNDPAFQLTELVTLGSLKFLVHHIVTPGVFTQPIHKRIAAESPDVVVFGHTHEAYARQFGSTLFFNPGYAGRPRFRMERSVALLHCEGGGVRHEFITL